VNLEQWMYSKIAAFAIALAFLFTGVAVAQEDADPYDPYRPDTAAGKEFKFDGSGIEKWKEQQLDVPLLSEAGLRRIDIAEGPVGVSDFYIDLDTLSIGEKDGIVRYWLVMESGGRRSNILYEGILCSDRKYKTFAYASPRRPSLVRYVEEPRWREIRGLSSRGYHYALVEDYFCVHGMPQPLSGIRAAVSGRINVSGEAFQDND
jgi:hypothetical protein